MGQQKPTEGKWKLVLRAKRSLTIVTLILIFKLVLMVILNLLNQLKEINTTVAAFPSFARAEVGLPRAHTARPSTRSDLTRRLFEALVSEFLSVFL